MLQSRKFLRPGQGLSALANRALQIKLFAAAATYGFTILLARTMLPQEFGMIAFFLNLSLFLSVVGARGQQIAALRYIPPLLRSHEHARLGAFISTAIRRMAFGTIPVFLFVLTTAFCAMLFGRLPNHSIIQLTLGLTLIPLVGWIDLQSHFARGYHLLTLSLAPKEIGWRVLTALIIVTSVILQPKAAVSATFVLSVLVLTLITLSVIQGLMLRPHIIQPARKAPQQTGEAKEWRHASSAFWITSISNIFLANADVIVVGLFAGSKAAGIYFAANRLAMLLAFFLTSTNTVLAPLLSAVKHSESSSEVADLLHQATVKMTIPTAALSAIMILFAPQFLLLFGPEFTQAAPAMRILILAGLFNAATGSADTALNMCGFQKPAMRVSAVSLAISITLLLLGAFTENINAVASAVLIATVVRKTLFWHLARRHLSVRSDIFAALARKPANTFASHI